jgi:hypothetical protein
MAELHAKSLEQDMCAKKLHKVETNKLCLLYYQGIFLGI